MKFLGQLFALGQKRECAMAQPGNTNTDQSYGNLKGGTISERDWNIFSVCFFVFWQMEKVRGREDGRGTLIIRVLRLVICLKRLMDFWNWICLFFEKQFKEDSCVEHFDIFVFRLLSHTGRQRSCVRGQGRWAVIWVC